MCKALVDIAVRNPEAAVVHVEIRIVVERIRRTAPRVT